MNHLDVLRAIVGEAHVLTHAEAAPYLTDWRERYRGEALAVVCPGSTEEVAAVVRLCAEARVPIVPQGVTLVYAEAPRPMLRGVQSSCRSDA